MIEHRPFVCAGHAEFDVRVAEVLAYARSGRWYQLDAVWAQFAEELSDHLDYEEREVFDDYEREAAAHAHAVARLRADHAALRDYLSTMAREIEARTVSSEAVDRFIDLLREHAQREDATVYAWLEQRRGRHPGLSRAP